MGYYIIGTAGHVDHGKTQLIKALTGEDTDRLKEEKERGISIELGFASLTLPSGAKAGVVDVPGHEKFVRQMLAGIGGIDIVLLVIAADEGVMPQTKEHLEIIDLLQVRKGFVVLNKIDLVDQEWFELVKLEIEEVLQGTVLEGADIIPTSALTGQGLDLLKERIDSELVMLPPRNSFGPCHLPIDRVFTVPGFGTIITGTMYRGTLKVGDSVVLEPGNFQARVRYLQVHGSKVDTAYAGQRVAVNVPNLEVAQVPRGASLLSPGYLEPVQTLDLSLHILSSAVSFLTHRQRVRFHIGTQEVMGRIHLLDREEIEPGKTAYAQILLEEPVIAARGDKFVIRQYSPSRTIGGGTILEGGNKKYKRHSPGILEKLAVKEKGTPEELVYAALQAASLPVETSEIEKLTGLGEVNIQQALVLLEGQIGTIETDGQVYWFSRNNVHYWTRGVNEFLTKFQETYCLRPGLPKEEFKSKFFVGWNNRIFTAFLNYLQDEKILVVSGNFITLTGFRPGPRGHLKKVTEDILGDFRKSGLTPPEWGSLTEQFKLEKTVSEELLQFLLRQGYIIKVAQNMYFSSEEVEEAKQKVIKLLAERSEFSASEAREKLDTSRKFLIPLLEFFDSQKLTRRLGEKRIKF